MNALSLYSGILGLDVAAHAAGLTTVAACECEPFCRRVIAHYLPNIPIYESDEDVTNERLRRDGIRSIDCVIGGPPCQPSSAAGKRLGAADSRWRWPHAIRIIGDVRPTWFVLEQPPGIRTVGAGRLFGAILYELAALGYRVGYDQWGAADVGAPHRRERLFLVGRRLDDADRQRRCVKGHDAPRSPEPTTGTTTVCAGLGAMANATGTRLSGGEHECCAETPYSDFAISSANVADATGRRRRPRQHDDETGQPDPSRRDQDSAGATQTNSAAGISLRGLGGSAHGLTRVVSEFAGWPARPGEAQKEWEAPRLMTGEPERVAKLKSLGNAVVWLQAVSIFEAIARQEVSA